ncbi:hypothetical protein [Mycobacterium hubeiense]|uniref:hypothetical protein n=1 Tax=Mycobacterium hubeiense TaxID=1867256 RepID=UPI001E486931|nr:hypothetical protein [Mycobacterium sp. QGD 101]
MRAVVLTEVVEFFTSISVHVLAKPTPGDRAVEAFVLGISACRTHPLVAAIQKFEPETLGSLASPEFSGSMETVRMVIASVLAGPNFPFDAAVRAAELLVRITVSLLLAPSDVLPVDTDERARWFARTYFVPLIEASAQSGPP